MWDYASPFGYPAVSLNSLHGQNENMKNKLLIFFMFVVVLLLSTLVHADVVVPPAYFGLMLVGLISAFLLALTITLILEVLVAFIFITITRISNKILRYVAIANFISLFFAFLVLLCFYLLSPNSSYRALVITIEIFVIIFEAYFIYLFNKKIIALKQSFVLSTLMNAVSFFAGSLFFKF